MYCSYYFKPVRVHQYILAVFIKQYYLNILHKEILEIQLSVSGDEKQMFLFGLFSVQVDSELWAFRAASSAFILPSDLNFTCAVTAQSSSVKLKVCCSINIQNLIYPGLSPEKVNLGGFGLVWGFFSGVFKKKKC